MRFGIVLPTYPLGATVEGIVGAAKAAERLGFASVWTTDHVIMVPEEAGPYGEIFEAVTTLAYLAAVTSKIKLGLSVLVVSQRNGVVLAKELATLDQLSQGRLIVGIGAGWNATEFGMLDAGDRFARRGAYLDETIRLWRHLWTAPQTAFQGTFYDLPPVAFAPLPVDGRDVPLWVGGSSVAARMRAGRVGAAGHPVGTTAPDLAAQLLLVAEAATKAGRAMPVIAPRLAVRFTGESDAAMSIGGQHELRGTAEELAEQIRSYRAVGVSEIVCGFSSSDGAMVVAQMERFSREVMARIGAS